MICYTYEDNADPNAVAPNGSTMTNDDEVLINAFYNEDLESFYTRIDGQIQEMKSHGAEAIVLYIHWGVEYQIKQNTTQSTIAQKMCDLGVDVIVGGHPHVVEPFETLTSTTGHNTYCIYSVGNAISNQRADTLANTTRNAQYTEDGMIFGVVFQKWNDGRVEVGQINILPTWVNKEYKGGKNVYTIVPLDTAIEAWNGYDVTAVSNTYKSYSRTMSIIGEGYNACREALGLPTVPLTVEAN
jgi:poly-gamma-glutamate synthesis protein (capsule biosynthesis protein)